MPVNATPFAPGPSPDLVAQADVTAALGGPLPADRLAALPGLTRAASRAIRRHCNRSFNRRPAADGSLAAYDGLYQVEGPGDRTLILNEFPVNRIIRVRTAPTTVLTVAQSDAATNQQATAELAGTSPEPDLPDVAPVVAGLTLARLASGVATSQTFPLASYPTLASLAAAIAAHGQGWTAAVTPGFESWATADFRGGEGPLPALGDQPAQFRLHATDLPFRLDQAAGILYLGTAAADDPWRSARWGPALRTESGDQDVAGEVQGIRVQYDAGWTVVPEDVQDAAIELVGHLLNRKAADQTLQSESDGARSWAARQAIKHLPESTLEALATYRNRRA